MIKAVVLRRSHMTEDRQMSEMSRWRLSDQEPGTGVQWFLSIS